MLHTITGENEVQMFTVTHLKKCAQAEWNIFNKFLQNESNDHCVEAKGSPFFQFIHDGGELKNDHEYQACGTQFTCMRLRCDNVVALS